MANLKKILYIISDVKRNLPEICGIFLSTIFAMIKTFFSASFKIIKTFINTLFDYVVQNFIDIIMMLFCLLLFILVIYEMIANIMIISNIITICIVLSASMILYFDEPRYIDIYEPKNIISNKLYYVIMYFLLWCMFRVCLFVFMRHDVLWNQNLPYICIHAIISVMVIYLWVYVQYYVRCWSCKKYAVNISDKCTQCGVCQKCCLICDNLENGQKCYGQKATNC